MTRTLISSGSSVEREIGYCLAVVQRGWVFVSGTTGFDYAMMTVAAGLADPRMRIEVEITALKQGR